MRLLIPILLIALAFGHASSVVAKDGPEPPLTLPLSLYIVDEAGASPTSELSSRRDTESLEQVLERMQTIWDQAGIELALGSIARIGAPADALSDLGRGDTTAFLNGLLDGGIEVPNPTTVRPTTIGETPNRRARREAPSTSQEAPSPRRTIPTITHIPSANIKNA